MHINLGNRTFKIVIKPLTDKNLLGYTDFITNQVLIDPNQSDESYKNTLLHECMHVGYDLFGLNDDDAIPKVNNEYLVLVSTNMLRHLAGLNPKLFSFIFNHE